MRAGRRLLRVSLFLSVCVLASPPLGAGQDALEDLTASVQSGLYLRWAEVTPEGPRAVPPRISTACYVPPSEKAQAEEDRKRRGPHASTSIRVFVNRVGEATFLPDRRAPFPAGTVILKEKLSSESPRSPGFAVGVMVKHAAPEFSETGGWQFLYAERTDSLRWRDGAAACSSCHATQRANDFVFAAQRTTKPAPR